MATANTPTSSAQMQVVEAPCGCEEAEGLPVKELSEKTAEAAAFSEESSDTEEDELEEFRSGLEDWDPFDIKVTEFTNVRKGVSFFLNDCKPTVQQKHKRDTPKSSPEAAPAVSLITWSKAEFQKLSNLPINYHHSTVKRGDINFQADQYAAEILSKLVKRKFIKQINAVICFGQDTTRFHEDTYHAHTYGRYRKQLLPHECTLKVYKPDISGCITKDVYLVNGFRIRKYIIEPTMKKLLRAYAEKEKRNLVKLKAAGVLCPDFIALHGHVLVTSFIGDDYVAARKLRYARLTEEEYLSAYNQVINAMKNMYAKANLIHTNITEWNILWYNNKCYFIDVGQAVEPCTLDVYYLLMEDCVRILDFFKYKDVEDILSPEELFEEIVGHKFGNKIALEAVIKEFNDKRHPEPVE